MTAVYIIGGIIIFLAAILLMPVSVIIGYDESFKMSVRVLFLRFGIYPSSAKAKKEKKSEKAGKPRKTRKRKAETETPKRSVMENLQILTVLIEKEFLRLRRHLRVKLSLLDIRVATTDAAKTALEFGAISAAASCLFELIKSFLHFKTDKIRIIPDFASDKTVFVCRISFTMNVYAILALMLGTSFDYLSLINAASAELEAGDKNTNEMKGNNHESA